MLGIQPTALAADGPDELHFSIPREKVAELLRLFYAFSNFDSSSSEIEGGEI